MMIQVTNVKYECIECGDKSIVEELIIGGKKFHLCNKCFMDLKMEIDKVLIRVDMFVRSIIDADHLDEKELNKRIEFLSKIDEWPKMAPKFEGDIE